MGRGQVRESGSRTARRLLAAAVFLPLAVLTTSAAGAVVQLPQRDSTASLRALLPPRADGLRGPARSAQSCAAPVVCSQVDVPLDRSGAVPGTVSLHVEVVPAVGVSRGAIFLIAGGPGQGSAHVFGLDNPGSVALYRFLFPGYTLVAYDDRGTGSSGLIDCPALQRALTADTQRAAATACAAVIGPGQSFYSTAQHAEDLEAVRVSIGVDRVALFGVSYGTKLAQAYALAHPTHVERLLLDSVVPPERDSFSADVLRRMPSTLAGFCSDGGCRAATRDFAGDVVAVANALGAKPLKGTVLEPSGKTVAQSVDPLQFLSLVLDADLNPGLAAELPAVVHAARLGNTQPLLRLARIHDGSSFTPSEDLSFGLYAATVCRDGPFPWSPDTPVADRPAILRAAVSALPVGTFGPFGLWAVKFGNADFCLGWPSPAGGAALGPGPLPDVPVLAVSGAFDIRTPTASAVEVLTKFPQGRLLVVPGVGHSVVTADSSGCAARAVRSWMQGGAVPEQCPRSKPFVAPVPALPAPGSAQPKRPAGPLQTYAIALKTIKEAEAMWLTAAPSTVAGIFGGKMVTAQRSFTLVRYTIARGVTLSGKIRLTKTDLPFTFEGTVTVGGAAASGGILGLRGNSLRGTLGGRIVG